MDFLYIISKTLPARNLCGGGLRAIAREMTSAWQRKRPRAPPGVESFGMRFPEAKAAKSVPCPRIGECAGAAADEVAPASAHRARFPEAMAAKRILSPRIGECAGAAADGVAPASAHRARFPNPWQQSASPALASVNVPALRRMRLLPSRRTERAFPNPWQQRASPALTSVNVPPLRQMRSLPSRRTAFLIFSDAFSARSVRQRARSAARWPAL